MFWGLDLQRATFRDVDLTGARIAPAIERARALPVEQRHAAGVVFEEHFQHLRYAPRDLARLA